MIRLANPACLIACLLLAPADEPGDLAGKWQVVATVAEGKDVPEADLKGRSIEFEGDTLTIANGTRLRKLNYSCDASKTPKEIDMSQPDGAKKFAPGIVSVEGDTMKLCYGAPGGPRPSAFASEPGSKCFFLTLKREPKK